MPLRCLIVDDNALFLEAASELLEREGVRVVGTASSIADALGQARQLRPDIILVDIVLDRESGWVRLVSSEGGQAPSVYWSCAVPG